MCGVCGNAKHESRVSRRDFLRTGALAALVPLGMNVAHAADAPAKGAPPPQNAISPADALKRIMDGNARYAANAPNERDFSSGRAARAQAQYPIASIVSCADSRVAPELAFDQAPGDLFVVRVAGNVVNTDLLASLEYGAQFLGSPLIMVLGHSNCGAIDAAIKVVQTKAVLPGHLPELIAGLKPAVIVAEKTRRATCSTTRSPRTFGGKWRNSRARRRSSRKVTPPRRSTLSVASMTSPPGR